MKKLLLVGGSGFIGSRLFARLDRRRIIATFHRRPFEGGVSFDIGTMRLADRFLCGRHDISHAFLLQGVTNIDRCAHFPDEAAHVNTAGVIRAIDDLIDASIKPIFISSDGVFDGSRGNWTEDDATRPILTYGKQKATVEAYLSGISSPWIVGRLSKVVSDTPDPRNILSEWLEEIALGHIIRCADDQIMSPIDIEDVVTALLFFTRTEANGLFNVCGSQTMSRYELLQRLLRFASREFGASAKVERCSLSDFAFREARPKNSSMSNDKFLRASGMRMRTMESVCEALCIRYFTPTGVPTSAQ